MLALLLREGWGGNETPWPREGINVGRGGQRCRGDLWAGVPSDALVPGVQRPNDLKYLPVPLGGGVSGINSLSGKSRELVEPLSPVKGFGLLSVGPESWGSCDVEHVSVRCG